MRPSSLPSLDSASSLFELHESRGVLVELSGQPGAACITAATARVRQAQREGETTVWIQSQDSTPFAPDLRDSGIDLNALVFIRVPPGPRRWVFKSKAAELLLRSGAYGLMVMDLRDEPSRAITHLAWQSRLWSLARQHHSQVVLLSQKSEQVDSLGPLVGLRVEAQRVRKRPGHFRIEHRILKNKAGIAPLSDEHVRGPWGLV